MRSTVEAAIRGKRLLRLDHGGGTRIVEPHLLGIQDGRLGIMAFQLEGYTSSGGLPMWRRLYLADAANASVLDRTFAGRRPFPSGKHSQWDQTLLVVDS